MIIESIDGRYYCNPLILTDTWLFTIEDDIPVLKAACSVIACGCCRQGHSVESANMNQLAKMFKLDWDESTTDQAIFADDVMKGCVLFRNPVILKPIPKPNRWATFYTNYVPRDQGLICWSYQFSRSAILDCLMGRDDTFLTEFLGKSPRDKIRRQVPYLKGARIQELNYAFYTSKLPDFIKLKRREAYVEAPVGIRVG